MYGEGTYCSLVPRMLGVKCGGEVEGSMVVDIEPAARL